MSDTKVENKAAGIYSDEVNEALSRLPPMEWTSDDEIALFTAIDDRPLGLAVKNFKMASIAERFHEISGKSVLIETIWEKLEGMYSIDLLKIDEEISSCQCNKCKPDVIEDFLLDQCYHDDVQSMDVPVFKDYTRQKKKEESPPPVATPKNAPPAESGTESEEEDLPLVKPVKAGRKSRVQTLSAKRDTPKRGTRTGAPSKDSSPARTKKAEEETSSKKERPSLGRSLRSRIEDEAPTPAKRPRRI